jgi:hypothetical protein
MAQGAAASLSAFMGGAGACHLGKDAQKCGVRQIWRRSVIKGQGPRQQRSIPPKRVRTAKAFEIGVGGMGLR